MERVVDIVQRLQAATRAKLAEFESSVLLENTAWLSEVAETVCRDIRLQRVLLPKTPSMLQKGRLATSAKASSSLRPSTNGSGPAVAAVLPPSGDASDADPVVVESKERFEFTEADALTPPTMLPPALVPGTNKRCSVARGLRAARTGADAPSAASTGPMPPLISSTTAPAVSDAVGHAPHGEPPARRSNAPTGPGDIAAADEQHPGAAAAEPVVAASHQGHDAAKLHVACSMPQRTDACPTSAATARAAPIPSADGDDGSGGTAQGLCGKIRLTGKKKKLHKVTDAAFASPSMDPSSRLKSVGRSDKAEVLVTPKAKPRPTDAPVLAEPVAGVATVPHHHGSRVTSDGLPNVERASVDVRRESRRRRTSARHVPLSVLVPSNDRWMLSKRCVAGIAKQAKRRRPTRAQLRQRLLAGSPSTRIASTATLAGAGRAINNDGDDADCDIALLPAAAVDHSAAKDTKSTTGTVMHAAGCTAPHLAPPLVSSERMQKTRVALPKPRDQHDILRAVNGDAAPRDMPLVVISATAQDVRRQQVEQHKRMLLEKMARQEQAKSATLPSVTMPVAPATHAAAPVPPTSAMKANGSIAKSSKMLRRATPGKALRSSKGAANGTAAEPCSAAQPPRLPFAPVTVAMATLPPGPTAVAAAVTATTVPAVAPVRDAKQTAATAAKTSCESYDIGDLVSGYESGAGRAECAPFRVEYVLTVTHFCRPLSASSLARALTLR